jgi:L-threonylcarbamoyladenylate synthase
MEIANGFENTSIDRAVELLEKGDVVAFPTETVYGLGADALNPYAVAKIFEAKNRPHFDPLIVHLGRKEWLQNYVESIPPDARKLIEAFWPGPLTLILQKKPLLPDIVTAGLPTVALRMPSHPVALMLIQAFRKPIAAPSANPFGYMSPTKVQHVAQMLKGRIPMVLDGGNSVFGIESTIVSFQDEGTYIHRHGAISEEELSQYVKITKNINIDSVYRSPGELPYHYAPMKPLKIIRNLDDVKTANSSFLAFREPAIKPISRHLKVLSKTGDLREAAANFFSDLIELDRDNIEIIYAERVPETGIGKAIMERLRKASKKGAK